MVWAPTLGNLFQRPPQQQQNMPSIQSMLAQLFPQQPKPQGFSFGPLTPVQTGLYEDRPELAYQQFMDYFGNGSPGFENTVFGRWASSQQNSMFNRYITQQAANPNGGLTWTKYLEGQAPGLRQQFQALPGYMRGSNPGLFRVRRELW